jgi:hypothetical protein
MLASSGFLPFNEQRIGCFRHFSAESVISASGGTLNPHVWFFVDFL